MNTTIDLTGYKFEDTPRALAFALLKALNVLESRLPMTMEAVMFILLGAMQANGIRRVRIGHGVPVDRQSRQRWFAVLRCISDAGVEVQLTRDLKSRIKQDLAVQLARRL
jgi:hypothetical protein